MRGCCFRAADRVVSDAQFSPGGKVCARQDRSGPRVAEIRSSEAKSRIFELRRDVASSTAHFLFCLRSKADFFGQNVGLQAAFSRERKGLQRRTPAVE
jgi:hypothetical protein